MTPPRDPVLFLAGLFSLLGIALAAGTARAAQPAAWVVRTNGAPTITRGGRKETLQRGRAVFVGDVVETDAASKVKILLADDSVLAVGPGSRLRLNEFLFQRASRRVRLQVLAGRFKIAVAKFFSGPTDYEVSTPTAVAGVRGTVLWGDTDLDAICALEGNITVRSLKSDAPEAALSSGRCVGEMGKGKTTPLSPTPEAVAGYLREVTLD